MAQILVRPFVLHSGMNGGNLHVLDAHRSLISIIAIAGWATVRAIVPRGSNPNWQRSQDRLPFNWVRISLDQS